MLDAALEWTLICLGCVLVLLWLGLGLLAAVVVHELGHAASCWLVGIPIRSVVVGRGRPILSFRIGITQCRFELGRLSGVVKALTLQGAGKRARIFFYSGGILANLAATAALALVFWPMRDSDVGRIFVLPWTALQTLFAVSACIPREYKPGAGYTRFSDGEKIRRALREHV